MSVLSTEQTKPRSHRASWKAPLAGIVLSLIAGLAAGYLVRISNAQEAGERFDVVAARRAAEIGRRLTLFQYGLRGARGAVIAGGGPNISPEAFNAYGRTRNIAVEFPGSRGFGFIRRVPETEEGIYLRRTHAAGRPDFHIRQLEPHSGERFVVELIAPQEGNEPAIGLDIASDRSRRQAAIAAMESGVARITAPITLVQAPEKTARGFHILLPVYAGGLPIETVEQRRAAAIGWTFTPIVIDEVLAGFDTDGEFAIALADHTDDPHAAAFATIGPNAASTAIRRTISVPIYGRLWDIEIAALAPFVNHLGLSAPGEIGMLVAAAVLLGFFLVNLYLENVRRRLETGADKARLAAFIETSHDAVIGHMLDGTITDWNAAAERLFGYLRDEALGRSVFDLIVPAEYASELKGALDKLRAGSSVPHYRTVRMTSEGKPLHVLMSISAIRSPGGALIGAVKMAHSIEAEVEAERCAAELTASLERKYLDRTAELEVSNALQTAILNRASACMIATDEEGRIIAFNPAAEQLLGYPAQAVIGQHVPALFYAAGEPADLADAEQADPGTNRQPDFALLVSAASDGAAKGRVATCVARSGAHIPVHLDVAELLLPASARTEHGDRLGYLFVVRDLREQLHREHQLDTARQKAEDASQAKSDFLASMSHEIRTPLNAVINLTDMIIERDTHLSATTRRQLDQIKTSGCLLLSIVNDVLDFSSVEAGHIKIESRPFNLLALIDRPISIVRPLLEKKGLIFDCDLLVDPTDWFEGDDAHLAQVLLNLLNNAVKFTETGRIGLSATISPDDGRRLHRVNFAISDTGIGIPQDKLGRLFRRFSQVDSSIRRRFGGTGLGLAISKGLVERMGGEIAVESEEGRGSTFRFSVPLARIAAPALRESGAASRSSKTLKILLAEDLEINQEIAIAILEGWGHSVDLARDGAEAVEMARLTHYDLILMDIQMPRMDGIAATRAIRGLGTRGATVPIVAMTANVITEQVAEFAAAGIDQHVGKPIVRTALFQVIETIVANAGSPTQQVADAPQDTEVFCRETFDELREIIPGKLIETFLARMHETAQRIEELGSEDSPDATLLAEEAHKLVSRAGTLGFEQLAVCSQALEHACRQASGSSGALQQFSEAAAKARDASTNLAA